MSVLAANDPTAGPDALRSGRQGLLPPDPLMNPAHRTDLHNRDALAVDLHSGDPSRVRFALSILGALQHAGDRTGTVQLVVYDSAAFRGQGRAAISVGDLTTATNVAVVVPGIANSPSSMDGGLDLAADLQGGIGPAIARQADRGRCLVRLRHTAVVAEGPRQQHLDGCA